MIQVNVHEAKTQLSRLIEQALSGEEVIIARAGHPVVRLVPTGPPAPRVLGLDRGLVWMADDFDAFSPEIAADFEDSDVEPGNR